MSVVWLLSFLADASVSISLRWSCTLIHSVQHKERRKEEETMANVICPSSSLKEEETAAAAGNSMYH